MNTIQENDYQLEQLNDAIMWARFHPDDDNINRVVPIMINSICGIIVTLSTHQGTPQFVSTDLREGTVITLAGQHYDLIERIIDIRCGPHHAAQWQISMPNGMRLDVWFKLID